MSYRHNFLVFLNMQKKKKNENVCLLLEESCQNPQNIFVVKNGEQSNQPQFLAKQQL